MKFYRKVSYSSVVATLLLCTLVPGLSASELKVYLTSAIPVKIREKSLKSDKSLAGVDVTVFGKFREFSSSNKQTPAKYVMISSSYLQFYKGYKAVYQLEKKNNGKFRFLILSCKGDWTQEKVSEGRVGIVDELGRKETKVFVKESVGSFKRVITVTKSEDLMTLLFMENADYIIIRPENYQAYKKKHKAKTIKIGESQVLGHAVICVQEGSTEEEIKKLGQISQKTLNTMGYSGLKRLEQGGSK